MRRWPTPVVFFALCAVGDFALGCLKGHSVDSGILGMILGLPSTALFFLVFRAFRKDDDSGPPDKPTPW